VILKNHGHPFASHGVLLKLLEVGSEKLQAVGGVTQQVAFDQNVGDRNGHLLGHLLFGQQIDGELTKIFGSVSCTHDATPGLTGLSGASHPATSAGSMICHHFVSQTLSASQSFFPHPEMRESTVSRISGRFLPQQAVSLPVGVDAADIEAG
jgi:hypothetical protein